MADELATLASKIKKIEEKVETLEDHIDTIRSGEDAAVEALVKKLRFKDGDEALDSLRAEKVALQNEKVALQNKEVELLKKENLLLQQQQQASAGTSMLQRVKKS
jgi:prefoldin subunit 5